MPSTVSVRIGLPASFTGVAIAILVAIFEVQAWKIPTPIAIALIVILSAMIVTALGMIVVELVKEGLRIREHHATSASWVSSEEPGLLDYEADGLRASNRLTKELAGVGKDTQKLGRNLARHTKLMQDPGLRFKAILKQKRGNQAAKSIDRSAIYIEKRAALLEALVKDVFRNYTGMVTTAPMETPEDRTSAETFLATLRSLRDTVTTTIDQTAGYRDTVRNIERQNLGRSVRISSRRLGDALDSTVKIMRGYKEKSRQVHDQLARRLSAK
jgi:hypothetical protein